MVTTVTGGALIAARIIALVIFLAMFGVLVTGKVERQWVTLTCGGLDLLLVFGLCCHSGTGIWKALNLKSIIEPNFWYGTSAEESFGISWSTILFIFGVWVMVEALSRSGFFKWVCLALAKAVHYRLVPLFIVFMLVSALLSMFIGSITVILFLAAVTVELARLLKFDPIPMVLAEIFCANLGGAATMAGDPPNIIIGTAVGFTFFDFFSNTGVMVLISLVIVMIFFLLVCRKELKASEANRPENVEFPEAKEAITNKNAFIVSVVVFILTVVLLITNKQTGLTITTIGLFAGLIAIIGIACTVGGKEAGDVMKSIDYKTLSFFIGLFLVVAGLQFTGCLDLVAKFIRNVSGGNPYIVVAIILWISAFASAFVDNIPFAATMVPVIQALASPAVPVNVLAYTLSIGTDIGGNATPIGASANVVGTSIVSKEGHPVTWGKYCKYNAPATILVVACCMLMIYGRYFWFA
ncbi:MAG: SLC13 family permease [Oscillospiraceae bacterium]|nr:SLC13 family permease [Oscillospiraceae bacterium]